ncbi:MAG: carboxylesterase family protein [Saprospiraceae bacterium]|nr:carboxylesterase family protein [Saprospiraceae bacterium]
MKVNIVFAILIIFQPYLSFTQPPVNRYTVNLFPNITETTNVLFSTNVPRPNPGGGFYETITGYPLNVDEFSTTPINLYMNIFQPTGDTLKKRPVIIISFGGGFVAGSKDHWSIRLMAQELAKRGFVTAVIDYRLGMNIFDEELSKRAVYRGVQDARSAVRFFKANAAGTNSYRIDPNNIYIGGHSAGAFLATHNAYLDMESERPASTYVWPQGCGFLDLSTCYCPDQLCLDCVGNNQAYSGHAKAIFSLAGAVGDVAYMQSAANPKLVMFHSEDDDTVPYNNGDPFSGITWIVVGDDLPTVYGSLPMSARANTIGLANQFFSYTNRGHSVHEETSSTLYPDIIPGISNWFFLQLLKPVTHIITGKTKVCNSTPIQTYATQSGLANYYQWQIIGGSFINMHPSQPFVTVQWSPEAPVKSLSLTPYSVHDAKGDQTIINITMSSAFQNNWTSNVDGMWNASSNWSIGYIPESCHNVIFPAQIIPITVTVPQNQQYQIKSINVGNKVTVKISSPTQLIIQN